MAELGDKVTGYSWWSRQHRPYTVAELVADGIVHVVGIVAAMVASAFLLIYAVEHTAQDEFPALVLYVATLFTVLGVSLAYNLWPVSPIKKHLARVDQAAIFLFMAGTYTPFLTLLGPTPPGIMITALVWGASLVGMALKLIVPERFGRLAIVLYLAIGWSGLLVFQSLAEALPASTLWLIVAGGVVYSLGIIFHLWEKLKFQNALWHVFVVAGAGLHLWAVIDVMVINRL